MVKSRTIHNTETSGKYRTEPNWNGPTSGWAELLQHYNTVKHYLLITFTLVTVHRDYLSPKSLHNRMINLTHSLNNLGNAGWRLQVGNIRSLDRRSMVYIDHWSVYSAGCCWRTTHSVYHLVVGRWSRWRLLLHASANYSVTLLMQTLCRCWQIKLFMSQIISYKNKAHSHFTDDMIKPIPMMCTT